MVGACIERKTVRDLVGRSSRGDHLRQLRRLRTAALPWPALLLEGDEEVASTSKAIPWGANALRSNSLDTSLRSSPEVLSFLADVALHSPVFVLTSTGPQDTVESLKSWTLVLERRAISNCQPHDFQSLTAVP